MLSWKNQIHENMSWTVSLQSASPQCENMLENINIWKNWACKVLVWTGISANDKMYSRAGMSDLLSAWYRQQLTIRIAMQWGFRTGSMQLLGQQRTHVICINTTSSMLQDAGGFEETAIQYSFVQSNCIQAAGASARCDRTFQRTIFPCKRCRHYCKTSCSVFTVRVKTSWSSYFCESNLAALTVPNN